MIINKKQFVAFLEYISLKGLDDDGKVVRVIPDCVLRFNKDYIECYGVDEDDNVIFTHHYFVDFKNKDEMEKLVVNDIKKWIDYANSFKGFEIEIVNNESQTRLSSPTEKGFYELPEVDERSITSLQKNPPDGPIMIIDEDWFQDIDRDKYSEFSFSPDSFLNSVSTGKNVDNMNTKLIIRKNRVEVRVGDIKDLTSPTFVQPDIDVELVNYVHEGKQEWSCSIGLHSISKVLTSIENKQRPSFSYMAENKNLIIKTNESLLNDASITSVWAIQARTTPKGYDDDNEDEVE